MPKVAKKKDVLKKGCVDISELDMDVELQPCRLSLSMTEMDKFPTSEIMKPIGMDEFNDDVSSVSTDMMMLVPQQQKNFMVLSTEVRNPCPNSKDQFNLGNFNSSLGGPSIVGLERTSWFCGLLSSTGSLPYAVGLLLLFLIFFPWTTALLVAVIVLLLMRSHSGSKPSKRTIKWTIQDFSEEIRGGFLTSPSFFDKTGQWRLVVRQKRCIDGVQTTFGLISTDIAPELEFVTATIKFSCTNQLGQELSAGLKDLKFGHKFECSGDCGYTRPFMFCRRQLGEEDVINIHCRIDFRKVEVGYFKYAVMTFANHGKDAPGQRKEKRNSVQEFGTVRPDNLVYQNALSVQIRPLTRFVQHTETKMFVWEIPNFNMLMQNKECWGLFSPQFFVNSHDFCSIWRMKILELHGVFRLHVQLRGLPTAVKQIKLWYLLQLVDNFGDSVVPEHSICRVKYPDHLNLWDTTRHILYRRETMLERFTSSDGCLTLRLSLHLEPNDLALLEADSDEWIRAN